VVCEALVLASAFLSVGRYSTRNPNRFILQNVPKKTTNPHAPIPPKKTKAGQNDLTGFLSIVLFAFLCFSDQYFIKYLLLLLPSEISE
jgi:hypothetical protein